MICINVLHLEEESSRQFASLHACLVAMICINVLELELGVDLQLVLPEVKMRVCRGDEGNKTKFN
jgi:hypothetical protein